MRKKKFRAWLAGTGLLICIFGLAASIAYLWPGITRDAVPAPAGAGGDVQPAPTIATEGGWSVDQAREFSEFTLYWLGETHEAMPLTKIIRSEYDAPSHIPSVESENVVLFMYGDCFPKPCGPPIAIRLEPYCDRPPHQLAPRFRETIDEIRGAPAAILSPFQVVIWTGDVRVTVFDTRGNESETPALDTAHLLMSMVSTGPQQGEPLPPAASDC